MDTETRPAEEQPTASTGKESAASFAAHLQSHIAPHFAELETRRQTLASDLTRRRFIAIAVALGLTGIGVAVLSSGWLGPFGDSSQILIVILVLIGGGAFYWSDGPRREFHKLYKTRIIPKVASFFGRFDYDPKGRVPMNRLKPSELIPNHDRYRSEDLFRGTYKDVGVEFCEAKLTQRRGSGKNRRTVTVFKGIFVLLEMNKSFSGKTVIKRDAGSIGNWFRNTFSGKLERVALEDPEFEKRFEVYSSDQVEARYLLTPAFMTRLEELARTVDAKGLQAAFYDSQLMIMLGNKRGGLSNISVAGFQIGNIGGGGMGNMFEPGSIYKPVGSTGDIERISAEFKSILDIVDRLKLDDTTRL